MCTVVGLPFVPVYSTSTAHCSVVLLSVEPSTGMHRCNDVDSDKLTKDRRLCSQNVNARHHRTYEIHTRARRLVSGPLHAICIVTIGTWHYGLSLTFFAAPLMLRLKQAFCTFCQYDIVYQCPNHSIAASLTILESS